MTGDVPLLCVPVYYSNENIVVYTVLRDYLKNPPKDSFYTHRQERKRDNESQNNNYR